MPMAPSLVQVPEMSGWPHGVLGAVHLAAGALAAGAFAGAAVCAASGDAATTPATIAAATIRRPIQPPEFGTWIGTMVQRQRGIGQSSDRAIQSPDHRI